jgi:hypothetical protein
MKNKTLLFLSGLGIIPAMLATMLNMIIGIFYWCGIQSEQAKFYIGKCNNEFIATTDLFGMFGLVFMLTLILSLSNKSDKLDRLDDAAQDLYRATKDMEAVRDKYTDMIAKL